MEHLNVYYETYKYTATHLPQQLRSFTVKCKSEGRELARTIGVVLYQRCFYIAKACPEKTSEVTGKWPGKNGGVSVGWENDVSAAFSCHVYALH